MTRIIIVEDETLVANDLKKLLGELAPDFHIEAVLSSLKEAVAWFEAHQQPELAFMDIQLSDGVSFELFNKVNVTCPVIFTTAYDEYAIRAFKVNSLDYLLKPVDKKDLMAAIDKYRNWYRNAGAGFQEQINHLLHDLQHRDQKKYKERFMVHRGRALVPVMAKDTSCFVKEELIYLVANDGERYLTDFETMDGVEELVNPSHFFRANRQYLININSVGAVRQHFNGKLIVSLKSPINKEVDVSREKAHAFKDWLA